MTLNVNSSHPYEVVIDNSYKDLEKKLKEVLKSDKLFLVTDDNVCKLPVYNEVLSVLERMNLKFSISVLESGESTKNMNSCLMLEEQMMNHSYSRNDTVIVLGGGVVGDLAGFASSIYMRGINFVQIPTTLLAMVDSSIGGKTAIDFKNTKNLIGTFHSPSLVYININSLNTLPQREINSGMGEVLKYAFLSKTINKSYLNFDAIKSNDQKVMELILKCLTIKKEIVENDEFESGKRALLNLGHTVGHAVEALSNFTLSHGECVVKGLRKVIDISKEYYNLNNDLYNEMVSMVEYTQIPYSYNFTKDDIIEKILHDKKSSVSGTAFVLLKDIGEPQIVKFSKDDIERYL